MRGGIFPGGSTGGNSRKFWNLRSRLALSCDHVSIFDAHFFRCAGVRECELSDNFDAPMGVQPAHFRTRKSGQNRLVLRNNGLKISHAALRISTRERRAFRSVRRARGVLGRDRRGPAGSCEGVCPGRFLCHRHARFAAARGASCPSAAPNKDRSAAPSHCLFRRSRPYG